MDRLEEMPISHGIQEMIVILHDTNRAFLIRYSRPERLSKSYWPYFNRHPSSATDLFPTSISPEGSIVEPAIWEIPQTNRECAITGF